MRKTVKFFVIQHRYNSQRWSERCKFYQKSWLPTSPERVISVLILGSLPETELSRINHFRVAGSCMRNRTGTRREAKPGTNSLAGTAWLPQSKRSQRQDLSTGRGRQKRFAGGNPRGPRSSRIRRLWRRTWRPAKNVGGTVWDTANTGPLNHVHFTTMV